MVVFGVLGRVWERLLAQHIYMRDLLQVEDHVLCRALVAACGEEQK